MKKDVYKLVDLIKKGDLKGASRECRKNDAEFKGQLFIYKHLEEYIHKEKSSLLPINDVMKMEIADRAKLHDKLMLALKQSNELIRIGLYNEASVLAQGLCRISKSASIAAIIAESRAGRVENAKILHSLYQTESQSKILTKLLAPRNAEKVLEAKQEYAITDIPSQPIGVSIIVPVGRNTDGLKGCLESIVNQTFKDIELVIIADGSIEHISKTVLEVKSLSEIDLKVFNASPEMTGPGGTRNYGIKIASKDFLGFVDSDDYIDEDYIERLAREARQDIDIIEASGHYREEYGQERRLSISRENRYESCHPLSGSPATTTVWDKLFRRQFILDNQISFAQGGHCVDAPFVIESYNKAVSIRIAEGCRGYTYRVGGDKSVTAERRFAKSFNQIVNSYAAIKYAEGREVPSWAIFRKWKSLHYTYKKLNAVETVMYENQCALELDKESSNFAIAYNLSFISGEDDLGCWLVNLRERVSILKSSNSLIKEEVENAMQSIDYKVSEDNKNKFIMNLFVDSEAISLKKFVIELVNRVYQRINEVKELDIRRYPESSLARSISEVTCLTDLVDLEDKELIMIMKILVQSSRAHMVKKLWKNIQDKSNYEAKEIYAEAMLKLGDKKSYEENMKNILGSASNPQRRLRYGTFLMAEERYLEAASIISNGQGIVKWLKEPPSYFELKTLKPLDWVGLERARFDLGEERLGNIIASEVRAISQPVDIGSITVSIALDYKIVEESHLSEIYNRLGKSLLISQVINAYNDQYWQEYISGEWLLYFRIDISSILNEHTLRLILGQVRNSDSICVLVKNELDCKEMVYKFKCIGFIANYHYIDINLYVRMIDDEELLTCKIKTILL